MAPTSCSIEFIGTATTIIRVAGRTILTDPNFVPAGESVSIGYGMSTRRLTSPSITFEQLPAIDFVLLSHLHGDHFDRIAEDRLDRNLPIITTAGAAGELQAMGFRTARGLDTWESWEPGEGSARLRVTALPARHAPSILSIALPDVMGSLIEAWEPASDPAGAPSTRIYISGDTVMFDGLRDIAERHPRPDVGIFHLGGTRVLGMTVTLDADQGLQAVRIIDPETIVPIHHDDYDVFESPLEDFVIALETAGLHKRLRTIERGETLDLSRSRLVTT